MINFMKFLLILFLSLFVLGIDSAFADTVFTTQSPILDVLTFDGKWYLPYEWKQSTEQVITYPDGTQLAIRIAHDYQNLYFFIDFISDTKIDKGADRATICLDVKNDKAKFANDDDFCFMIALFGKNVIVLQGGSPLHFTSNFYSVSNTEGAIGVGSISANDNRYTHIPHSSYEFSVPIDLVGRTDIYGFYVGVYEASSKTVYSWPQQITLDRQNQIPSPSQWGELVSPDKSIPEFGFPFLALIPSLILILIITRIKNGVNLKV